MPNSRSLRSLSSCPFAGLLLLFAADARAEAPSYAHGMATTWSQEVLTGVQQEVESPELKALRLAEEELFSEGEAEDPREAKSAPEAAFEAPPESIEVNGRRVDLAFLKGLELPSLPVRWDRRVIEYLMFFKDDPRGRELAAGWIKRRERFGALIRRVLDEQGLPDDLLYVAMIESGFDPTARSQVDAWGMWQFMQQPGASYGLRIDRWVDERLDPEKSTRAAAHFMSDLRDRFGSWELAFAAYNMGYGGLLRAIKKFNTNDYWLLSHLEAGLPFETSLYVSKITAMAIVGHNPQRFGLADVTAEKPRAMARIDVAPGTTLDEIALAAGVGLDQIKLYNPHLKQARTPPGEDVQVYVPRESQVHFAQRWAERKSGASVTPYTLRMGESLEDLAKRADTSAQSLRELNALAESDKLKPGFTLFVPAHAKPTRDLVEPMVATVPPREFAYEGKKRMFYRVGEGDDLSKVAQHFELTNEELLSWNSLSPGAALQTGMLLQLFVRHDQDLSDAIVYAPSEVRILTLGSDEFFAYHEAQRGRERVRYRVQPGDTLSSLGQRFEMSTGSLGRINQFPSDRELKAGETMILYVPKAEVAELASRGAIAPLHDELRGPELAPRDETPAQLAARSQHAKPEDSLVPPAAAKEAPRASAPVTKLPPPVTWASEAMAESERDGKDRRVKITPLAQRTRALDERPAKAPVKPPAKSAATKKAAAGKP